MGTIIIANMQAQLTMNSRQFDEGADKAEARLAAIEQRINNLPAEVRSNVGQATGDPDTQRRQRRKADDNADAAERIGVIQRVGAAQTASDSLTAQSANRVVDTYALVTRKIEESSEKAGAAVQTLREKIRTLAADAEKVAGVAGEKAPITTKLQAPAPGTVPTVDGVGGFDPSRLTYERAARDAKLPSKPTMGPEAQAIWDRSNKAKPAENWWSTASSVRGAEYDADYGLEEAASAEEEAKRLKRLTDLKAASAGNGGYPAGFKPSGVAMAGSGYDELQAAAMAQEASHLLSGPALEKRIDEMAAANPQLSRDEVAVLVNQLSTQGKRPGVVQVKDTTASRTRPAGAVAAAGGASGAVPSTGPDADDGPSRVSRRTPYGQGTYSYERAYVTQSPIGAAAQGFLGNVSPQAAGMLPAVAGPAVALVVAATALGAAFMEAKKAVDAYSAAEFVRTEQAKGANALPDAFVQSQQRNMRGLGVQAAEESQLLTQLQRYTSDQGEIVRVQKEAADFARANGISMQESLGMFIDASQGNAGAFQRFMPNVRQGDTFDFVEQEAAKRYGGAAERFMATPQGQAAEREAKWNEAMIKAGQDLEGVFNGTAEAGELLIPVLSGVLKGFGMMVGSLTDVIGMVGGVVGGVIELAGVDWAQVGRGLGKVGEFFGNFKEGQTWLDNHLSPSGLTQATGVMQNAAGEYGVDTSSFGSVKTYDEMISGLAARNTNMTPEQLRAKFGDQQALYAGISAGQFNQEGAYVGANGAAGAAGTGGVGGQLANTSAASISAMRTIQEEVSSSGAAISGVQDVFSKLTTFHVDFNQVKPNLDNLKSAVIELQKFWIDAATGTSGVTVNTYNTAKTWMDMVGSMATMMSGASDGFVKVEQNAAMMPSEQDIRAVVDKSVALFKMVDDIAIEAMKGKGAGEQGLDVAYVQGWATAMNGLVTFSANAAEAMGKIEGTNMPDPAEIRQFGSRTKETLKALNDVFFTTSGDAPFKPVTTSNLADLGSAAAQAKQAGDLLDFAGKGVALFTGMRGLRIPSIGDIEDLGVGLSAATDMVAALAHAAIKQSTVSSDLKGIAMAGMGASAGDGDQYLQKAARYVGNAAALLDFAGKGVAVLGSFRGLNIPDPAFIQAATDATGNVVAGVVGLFNEAQSAFAKGGGIGQVDLVDEARYIGDATKLVDFVGSGATLFQNMRRLHVPGASEIRNVVRGTFDIVNAVANAIPKGGPVNRTEADGSIGAASAPKVNGDALLEAGKYSVDAIKLVDLVTSGANAIRGMRRLHIPSRETIGVIVQDTVEIASMIAAELPKNAGTALVYAGQWAEDAGKLVGVASGVVDVMKGMRRLHMPGVEAIREFVGGVGVMTNMLIGIGAGHSDAALESVEAWAAALGPAVGVANGVATLLQGLRKVREPMIEDIRSFVHTTDTVTDMLISVGQAGRADAMMESVEIWAAAMGPAVNVAVSSMQLTEGFKQYMEPAKADVDSFIHFTGYMSDAFVSASKSWGITILDHAADIAEDQAVIFSTMQGAMGVMLGLPAIGKIPAEMITGLFDNMDIAVDEFTSRTDDWDKKMRYANTRVAADIKDEFDALSSGADFFGKLGTLRPDYSHAIIGFFDQLRQATDEFAASTPTWKKQMSKETALLADYVGQEGEALSKALDPLTKMEAASLIRPDEIFQSFENVRAAVTHFGDLANMPELQGENLTKLKSFSGQVSEIFGAMNTAIDAANVLSEPGGAVSTGTFSSVMDDFFMQSVPAYATVWAKSMGEMAGASEDMSGRVIGAMADTPMGKAAGLERTVPVGGSRTGSGGGSGVYTNCIFIGNDLIATNPDVANLIVKLTQQETIKQGGVPVGK